MDSSTYLWLLDEDTDTLHAYEIIRGDTYWNAGTNYFALCGAVAGTATDADGYCIHCQVKSKDT